MSEYYAPFLYRENLRHRCSDGGLNGFRRFWFWFIIKLEINLIYIPTITAVKGQIAFFRYFVDFFLYKCIFYLNSSMVSWGYFIAGLTWITSISYSFAHWFPNIRSKSHGVFTIWMWIFFIISVSLIVWGSSSKSRTFNSYVDVTNGSEWLQRLTYTRHSWQLSNKDSLACYNYCDSGHSFIMVISEDPWHTHISERL